MRLRESTIIAADATAVWPLLADPLLQADWNPKIVSIERERAGPVRHGERFEMLYRMGARENLSRVEVTAVQPFERVVFVHRMQGTSGEQVVEEAYEISPHGQSVRLVQTVDLTRAGIPWVAAVVVWVIHRFGRNAEKAYLARLRTLAERPVNGITLSG